MVSITAQLSGRRILVTGADGFIGSHLTEELVRRGRDVRAFVFYNSFNSWGWLDSPPTDIRSHFEVFAGDVRDPYGVASAMKGCDVVLHLAALIAIPYSYHSPDTYVETNVKGTLNVLQAARDLGMSRVVHTSTSEVYGTARYVPINEEHPLQGQSPYSATKIGADQLAMSLLALVRDAGRDRAAVQHLRAAASARAVIPTIITQIAQRGSARSSSALQSHARFQICHRYGSRLIHRGNRRGRRIGQVINIGSNFEISIGDTRG